MVDCESKCDITNMKVGVENIKHSEGNMSATLQNTMGLGCLINKNWNLNCDERTYHQPPSH